MKPSDIFQQLPSLPDLLNHPRIAPLAEKLQPGVVADRLRGLLNEVRGELGRRVGDFHPPSIQELAERFSSALNRTKPHELLGVINATGALWGSPWSGPPLAAEAIEAMRLAAIDFQAGRRETGSSPAERMLASRCGAQDALALHSREAALWLVLATHGGEGVAVARGEVGNVSPGVRLTDLAASAGAKLIEVGATDENKPEDFESTPARLVLRANLEGLRLPETGRLDAAALAALCRRTQKTFVVDLGHAPPVDLPPTAGVTVPSAASVLRSGAQLVVLAGEGLLGGPCCGVIVGESQAVARLRRSMSYNLLRLDAPREAALAATLQLQADPDQAALNVPVWALLTAPLENLRTRAERIAPQLNGGDLVATAAVVELAPQASPLAALVGGIASWGVALEPRSGDATKLAEDLLRESPAIVGRPSAGRLLLDLRTVFPRQDLQILTRLGGHAPPAEGAAEGAVGDASAAQPA